MLRVDFHTGAVNEHLTLSVPEVNLESHFKGKKGRLLVFDDLDRCMMPVSDVLGYINAFVEHDGMKVILVANEAEITRRDASFPSIKEKLVGQTLRVRSDIKSGFPEFLKQIATTKVRDFLAAHQDRVLTIHTQSETNNFRILKQAMWDFERLANNIPEAYWNDSDSVLKLMSLAFSLSMEIRFGRIRSEHLPKLMNRGWDRYFPREQNKPLEIDEEFEARYSGVSLADPVFRPEVLGRIIIEGLNNPELVRQTLKESRYFSQPSDIPAWIRAWSMFQSDDDQYETALAEVHKQFEERKELDCAVLYHIFGILLRASDIGALPMTRAELLAEGKAYVDDIRRDGRIVDALQQSPQIERPGSFAGYGYTEIQSAEFQEFVNYYSNAAQKAAMDSYELLARGLLKRLDEDPIEFYYDLCMNNVRSSPYFNIPILASLPASDFVTKLLAVSVDRQMRVFGMFKDRYQYADPEGKLSDEKCWLAEVRRLLLEALPTARPVTRYRLNSMIETDIDPFLITPVVDERSATAEADQRAPHLHLSNGNELNSLTTSPTQPPKSATPNTSS